MDKKTDSIDTPIRKNENLMLILKSENIEEFQTILKQLNAANIPVCRTQTPGYFTYKKKDSAPQFKLFIIVITGVFLGGGFISLINSVWLHQIGNKPQDISGIIGWLPVIFEITILFTAFVYFIRFMVGISKKEKEDFIQTDPLYYYCFLDLNDTKDKELILKEFNTYQIIEC